MSQGYCLDTSLFPLIQQGVYKMGKWYCRSEISGRITREWVLANCKITQREFELLKIIHKRKLVRRDMLEIISPSYRNLGPNRTRILNRSLTKLFKMSCIDKVHEKQTHMDGNTPAIVAIDKCGAMLLGVKHRPRIKRVTKTINGQEFIFRELPVNFKHINGINQLEVDTILFCEQSGSSLLNWVLEQEIKFHYGSEIVQIIPDVIAKIRMKNKDFALFIEFDMGTESARYTAPPKIKEKIMKYKKYRASGLYKSQFPVLVFVANDKKRIDFFNSECEKIGLPGVGMFNEKYKTFLERVYRSM